MTRAIASLGCFLGLPSPLCTAQQNTATKNIHEGYAGLVPSAFRITNQILQQVASYLSILDGTQDDALHFSLTQSFGSQLDGLKLKNLDSWTVDLEIEIQAAKLSVYSLTFSGESLSRSDPSQRPASAQIVFSQGLAAATTLVSAMAKLCAVALPNTDQKDCPGGLLTFRPKYTFTNLYAAAAFLFHFLCSEQGGAPEDHVQAITGLTEAHKIFLCFSSHRDHVRAANSIELFASILRNKTRLPQLTDKVVVTHRLAASLMQDAGFKAAQYRNYLAANGDPGPPSAYTKMHDQITLPPAPEQIPRSSISPQAKQPMNCAKEDQESAWLWQSWDSYMEDIGTGLELDSQWDGLCL